MAYIQMERAASVIDANKAVPLAFGLFGCETLGGISPDGWSKTADLQRCPYRYYLRHEANAVPTDTMASLRPNLEIGSMVHAALAVHYGRQLPVGYPGWRANMPNPYDLFEAFKKVGADLSCIREAEHLFGAYQEHYGVEDDIEPVAVEMMAGIEGTHTCRYDALVWHEQGLWVLEHKTASAASQGATALESWWLDGEIIGQCYAYQLANLQELFGVPLSGVIVNLIFKAKPTKFQRLKIVVPKNVLAEYIRDRQWWAEQKARFRKTGHWPRALNGCSNRYGTCDFWAHCRDIDASAIKFEEKAP